MERGIQVDTATQWLKENRNALFECPKLPGRLRLSPEACSVRYRKANARDFVTLERTEWCAIGLKMSLAVCRGCTVGRQHAKGRQSRPPSAPPRRRAQRQVAASL
jgi:hypothetical protein